MLSCDGGRLFGGILRDLAERGYDAEWDCIPASAFGAPHMRYRVFIVAHAKGCGRGQAEYQLREWELDAHGGRSAVSNDDGTGRAHDSLERATAAASGGRILGADGGRISAAAWGLNPTWVEWLMGFPVGWTDCEDSVTP